MFPPRYNFKERFKSMKIKPTTIIMIVACLLGLSLLLYPYVSSYINEKSATKAINTYYKDVNDTSEADRQRIIDEALEYNREIFDNWENYNYRDELKEEKYYNLLNSTSTGIMGVLEIPKIDVSLPIYHGTQEKVLQIAVGHIEWSSLPVGGEGSHCVVSGHRGLPSAKLFTELDAMREGDCFTLTIFNETLTYEIDQIRIVLPNETDSLYPEEGKDLCTLVTCTPYGVNTHRLLVRGHRVENVRNGAVVVAEAVKVEPLLAALVMEIPLLFALLLLVLFKKPEKKKKETNLEKAERLVKEEKND